MKPIKNKSIEFEPFVKIPLDEVENGFRKTGKYNEKFIKSVIKGLGRSSLYVDNCNNSDQDFMKLAIEEAKASLTAGGAPIGAIMVKDGEIIAMGWSMVWPEKDPTSHAKTNCIKAAYKKLHPNNLVGCTLYSTLESCSMCLGCGSWAGLSKVVFGAYSKDIPPNPYELSVYTAKSHGKRLTPFNDEHKMEVVGGVLKEECAELMKNVENWKLKI